MKFVNFLVDLSPLMLPLNVVVLHVVLLLLSVPGGVGVDVKVKVKVDQVPQIHQNNLSLFFFHFTEKRVVKMRSRGRRTVPLFFV